MVPRRPEGDRSGHEPVRGARQGRTAERSADEHARSRQRVRLARESSDHARDGVRQQHRIRTDRPEHVSVPGGLLGGPGGGVGQGAGERRRDEPVRGDDQSIERLRLPRPERDARLGGAGEHRRLHPLRPERPRHHGDAGGYGALPQRPQREGRSEQRRARRRPQRRRRRDAHDQRRRRQLEWSESEVRACRDGMLRRSR
mmetsp:Transcript_8943/g.16571  ORF Transcript_8943/g.16571 Transcript_8943/m.16571 type:complete len:200 (+) Transcript_8943:2142-2741(+)